MDFKVELSVFDEVFRFDKLRPEEVVKCFARAHNMRKLHFWIQQNLMEQILDLALKIFLRVLFDLRKLNLFPNSGSFANKFIDVHQRAQIVFAVSRYIDVIDTDVIVGHEDTEPVLLILNLRFLVLYDQDRLLLVVFLFLQPQKDLFVEVVFVELSFEDRVGVDILPGLDHVLDLLYLLGSSLVLLLLQYLLLVLPISFRNYLVHREVNLPEGSLDESGDYVGYDDVHDAEVDHHVAKILGISPTVIISNHGPPSLGHHLNHHELCLDEILKGGHLSVDVVFGRALSGVGVVEKFHADDAKEKESEQEERHELEDNRHDLQSHLKDVLNLVEEGEFEVIQVVAV